MNNSTFFKKVYKHYLYLFCLSLIGFFINFFLAKKYISYFVNNEAFELLLFGSKNEVLTTKDTIFFKYSLPNFELKLEEVLTCDVVFYFSAAGVQANVKTETDLIYKVNTYEPISISQYLDENDFQGKFITFCSYFEIGFNS